MTTLRWRKSSYSGSSGNCVEVAEIQEAVLVRNSNRPDAGTLVVTADAIATLIDAVKAGELDEHV